MARCKPGQALTCCWVVAAAEAAGASRKRLAEASCTREEADGAAMASLGSLAQEHAGCAAGEGRRSLLNPHSSCLNQSLCWEYEMGAGPL